jgi:hypothetical protein
MLNKIIDCYEGEDFLRAEGFDEAIIGVNEATMQLIYSVKMCIRILMRDMSELDVIDYFEYNMAAGYVGEKNPIWCNDNL